MGTYENFYLNQIKQLQEENKKLKQIIDEGIVGAGVRTINGLVIPQGYRRSPEPSGPVVPGRIDPKVAETLRRKKEKPYASDDMESRRTRPGYGPSSDSQGAGPKADVMIRMRDERIRRARESGDDTIY